MFMRVSERVARRRRAGKLRAQGLNRVPCSPESSPTSASVRHIEKRGDTHLVIGTHYDVAAIEIGASIACSGACMTVVDKGSAKDRWFAVTASAETLSKTTMGDWKVGDPVNLERPMSVGDELGGHIVTGHVDGVAEVTSVDAGRRIHRA